MLAIAGSAAGLIAEGAVQASAASKSKPAFECSQADCSITSYHNHNRTNTLKSGICGVGKGLSAYRPCIVEDCTQTGRHHHNAAAQTPSASAEPQAALQESSSGTICNTSGCNRTDSHSHSLCSVSECSIVTNHEHDGTLYYGHHNSDGHGYHNGGNSGGQKVNHNQGGHSGNGGGRHGGSHGGRHR